MRVTLAGFAIVVAAVAAGAVGGVALTTVSEEPKPVAAREKPIEAATITERARAPKLFATFTPPPRATIFWPEPPYEGAADADAHLDAAYVTGGAVNLREAPTTEAGVLRTIPWGKRLMALGETDGEWRRVLDVETGAEGWMFGRYLADEMPTVRRYARRKTIANEEEKTITAIEPVKERVWDRLGAKGREICPCR